jgi:membrane protease YdiL (CAAX protease family)
MKKEIKNSLLILVGFLVFLWLEKPLREILINCQINELSAQFISGIFIRSLLIIASLIIITKLNLNKFLGIYPYLKIRNLQAVVIPLGFITIGIISNFGVYLNTNLVVLILFSGSVLAIGFVEELIFRGILLPLFIKSFINNKNSLLLSVILSSLLFSCIHLINLISQPDNLVGILSQVFFALSIGVFFGGLMLRTENILVPAILHALINFAFGSGKLKNETHDILNDDILNKIDWSSLVPTTIFFIFIFLSGIYMIRKVYKEYSNVQSNYGGIYQVFK